MEYNYKIFVPGGNKTALIIGIESDIDKRKIIQDIILLKHRDVEQVGFVNRNFSDPQLVMSGEEFCGNATRSAVYFYLEGKPGEISINVSGTTRPLAAGITDSYETWTEMPVYEDLDKITTIDDELYFVEMEGISHLVLSQKVSFPYLSKINLSEDGKRLKHIAKSLLMYYGFYGKCDCGVIFTENVLSMIKIHPCIFTKRSATEYYETACGSGSAAVGLVNSKLLGKSDKLQILQPSGKVIETSVEYKNGKIVNTKIGGFVSIDELSEKDLNVIV